MDVVPKAATNMVKVNRSSKKKVVHNKMGETRTCHYPNQILSKPRTELGQAFPVQQEASHAVGEWIKFKVGLFK